MNCSYKVEQELGILFDNEETDVMEIEAGLLCRRKREDGTIDWYIDI